MAIASIITGIGLVTPLGRNARTTFDALLSGCFIASHAGLEPRHSRKTPRVISLAIEAADEAMAQADWTKNRQDIAIVASTSKGSVESWLPSTQRPTEPGYAASDRAGTAQLCVEPSFGLADLSTHLAGHVGSTGPRLCLSAACASGLHGLIRAAMLIQSGLVQRVLVVAAEASVHPLFLASFQRLGVLPPPGGLCRPFDRNRNGFLMSDAAAAVCLEGATSENNSRSVAAIDRYALGGDASHLTASDPESRVLRHLLRQVIADRPVDLVHAHGTGTIANDGAELAALNSILNADESRPALYSHKAALGHSLGASGLVSVAINCLCHQTGIVPGNINTKDPMPSEIADIQLGSSKREIHRSLVLAAGFGGPLAVVSLVS